MGWSIAHGTEWSRTGHYFHKTMDIDLTPFINAGIPGILLLWFMLRLERILNRFEKTVQVMARAVIRLLERHDPELASSLSKALSRTNGDGG